MDRTVLAWSGGKDAAWGLRQLLRDGAAVHALWTTINEETGRSSMHGVRESLYHRQADAIGLPLLVTRLPGRVDNEAYQTRIRREARRLAEEGVDTVAYGDINLEDVRRFRETTLDGTGVAGYWPLWGADTESLVQAVLDAGFEATVVAIDTDHLDVSVLGSTLGELVDDRPSAVDPAGEGGSFHTFVTDGPVFDYPVSVDHGEVVTREVGDATMAYLDLVPAARDR